MPVAAKHMNCYPCNATHLSLQAWAMTETQKERTDLFVVCVNLRSEFPCIQSQKTELSRKIPPYLSNWQSLTPAPSRCLYCLANLPISAPLGSAECCLLLNRLFYKQHTKGTKLQLCLHPLQSPARHLPITARFWLSFSHQSTLMWLLAQVVFEHQSVL